MSYSSSDISPDRVFMKRALELAEKAASLDEIPVGAVIVHRGEIISEAYNRNREENDPTLHAEMTAIKKACKILGNERLTGCILYVTKEPCVMCSGAIVHSRIERVVIGARDMRYGACGTVLEVCGNHVLNHVPEIEFGILGEECSDILKNFFKAKREKQKISNP